MKTHILTPKQWQARLNAINKKNLKTHKKTISLIDKKMDECITTIYNSDIEIDIKKYKECRKICLSKEFLEQPQKFFPKHKFINIGEE